MGHSGALEYRRGVALAALGMVVLSPDALLIRLIESASPIEIVFYRTLFAGVVLLAGLGLFYGRALPGAFRAIGRPGLISAALLAASNFLFVGAIAYTSVANTLLILATTPLFGAILGRILLGERVAPRTWAAIAAGLAGVGVIVQGSLGAPSLAGDAMALGVAFTQGLNVVVVRRAGQRDMTPALCLAEFAAAAVAWPLAGLVWLGGGGIGLPGGADFWLLLALGCIVLPVSFALYLRAARYLPAAELALFALVETVLGPFWVWLGIGEVPSAQAMVGGAIVMLALIANAAAALNSRERH